ncbi:hypothetical protein LCGC14_2750660 [marine sediment metagenome]|uniref:Uncharacterized protein n=1 Tax=marine sediment metagenome TaxID=412755 RepID=A0A0F9BAG7_9ZZZZ
MQQAEIRSVWTWNTAAEARAFLIGVEHNDALRAVQSHLKPERVIVTRPSLADYDTIIKYKNGKMVCRDYQCVEGTRYRRFDP